MAKSSEEIDTTGTERVTVTLIPRASRELADLQSQTKLSRTDLVNRAIGLYAFVSKQLESGRDLAIYDARSDTTQIIYVT